LRNSALYLTFHNHRIYKVSEVIDTGVGGNFGMAGLSIHLDFANVNTCREDKIGRVMEGTLTQLTAARIESNKRYKRLYPLLKDGVLDLLSAKLRWSNEAVEIVPQSVHGNLRIDNLGGTIRIRDALNARVRGEYTRVVYPYFSEEPALPEEGGRMGLWVMQQALKGLNPDEMRIIDVLRRTFFSPQTTPLQGNEEAILHKHYHALIC